MPWMSFRRVNIGNFSVHIDTPLPLYDFEGEQSSASSTIPVRYDTGYCSGGAAHEVFVLL